MWKGHYGHLEPEAYDEEQYGETGDRVGELGAQRGHGGGDPRRPVRP